MAQRQAAEDVLVRHLATGQTMMVPRATLRAAPDEYQTIHNAFVEPTPLEVACASLLAHKTTWRLPDLEAERAEFERAGKLVGVPGNALLEAARTAPTVVLSDAMWSTMQNTDSWSTDTIDKAIEYARLYDKDIRDLILGLGGSMETPMVIQRPDGSTVLVGGNTRLMTFRAFGLRPRVLLVPQPQAKFPLYKDKNMPRDPAFEFKHALTVRNVVARFKGAMEHDSPEALKKYLEEHPHADKANHHVKDQAKPDRSQKPGHSPETIERQLGGKAGNKAEASKPGGALHKQLSHGKEHLDHVGEALKQFEKATSLSVGEDIKDSLGDVKKLFRDAVHVGGAMEAHANNLKELTDWPEKDIAPVHAAAKKIKAVGEEMKAISGKSPTLGSEKSVDNYVKKVKELGEKYKQAMAEYEKAMH